MSIIKSYRLTQDYIITVGAPWVPPFAIVPRVDEIWELEKQRQGINLTNGQIYTLASFQPNHLVIRQSEYKYALAQRRGPDLQEEGLNIRPLAVTGVLICADGLVVGRRGPAVTDDLGLWEPAPAGGLSTSDPKVQVLEELEEELGILGSKVKSVRVCGLVEDQESGVFDIVFRLEIAATSKEVMAVHSCHGSDEYADLEIVESSMIPRFLHDNRNDLLPALWEMLRLASVV